MERLAREGCNSLTEYLQVPPEMVGLILPTIQYKNLRFITLELSMLVNNLSPILKDKTEHYKVKIQKISSQIDKRNLFLRDVKIHGQINFIEVLPFFSMTLSLLIGIKSDIIKDIGGILYLGQEENKKTW
jgi:hypothetical protein